METRKLSEKEMKSVDLLDDIFLVGGATNPTHDLTAIAVVVFITSVAFGFLTVWNPLFLLVGE